MIKRTLYFSTPVYLTFENEQLKASIQGEGGKDFRSFPLEDIGLVIVENLQSTTSNYLISKFAEYKIAFVVCGTDHMPNFIGLPLHGNTLIGERSKVQLKASLPVKKNIWQQIIRSKLQNQSIVLNRIRNHADFLKIHTLSKSVLSGDSDNKEGRAAAIYWRSLFGATFIRDHKQEGINSALNFGYAIIRGAVARAIVGAGLLPILGVHHKNKYNAFPLADDLIEPFRPVVDLIVYEHFLENGFDFALTKDLKSKLLLCLTIDVRINDSLSPLWNSIQQTVNSLFKIYNMESRLLEVPTILNDT